MANMYTKPNNMQQVISLMITNDAYKMEFVHIYKVFCYRY